MMHLIILAVLVALALIIAFKACVFLLRNTWLGGFIRGVVGLSALTLAVLAGLMAWDIYSYQTLPAETSVGRIAFTKTAPQTYRVNLTLGTDAPQVFELNGDQWQLDTRFIKLKPRFSRWGMAPLYRIERFNGRYFSLDDELNKPRSVHPVTSGNWPVDTWQWLYSYHLPLFDAAYGAAIYLPAEDGAEFELSVGETGLIARPLNPAARAAVHQLINVE